MKRKVSVTIDADLFDEIEATDENLSARVNESLRQELAARRRRRALAALLDRLDVERGPLDSPDDEAEIQRSYGCWVGRPSEAGPRR